MKERTLKDGKFEAFVVGFVVFLFASSVGTTVFRPQGTYLLEEERWAASSSSTGRILPVDHIHSKKRRRSGGRESQ